MDLVVAGGGVTGAAVALDAASRGFAVALLEAADWASGASGRPVALVPAGAAGPLRAVAPHLARPVPVLRPSGRAALGAAAGALAGLLGVGGGAAAPRWLPPRAAAAALPGLRPEVLAAGAVRTRDARVDEARLALALVRTAAGYGARVLTRARVTGLLGPGGPVLGVGATDRTDGSAFRVRARAVVLALGAADLPGLPGPGARTTGAASLALLPGGAVPGRSAAVVGTPGGELSLVPADGRWALATTGAGTGLAGLLDLAALVLRRPPAEEEVLGVHASTVAARERGTPAPGLVLLRGIPLAEVRGAAAEAVDDATAGLPGVPPSRTAHLPLVGARGVDAVHPLPPGLPAGTSERLRARHGDGAVEVLDLVRDDPTLGRPLPGAPGVLAAEVVHAVTAEGALDLRDVLLRRARMPRPTAAAARAAAALAAGPLGWDDGRVAREVAATLPASR
ncbi:FAD-dependent oxidoreductase [Geodermatophilus marinus]|uniref:FAD-dependent oxidoreductase n=1 Tax=Geodermatophilus sp. LHW52908 TaxID=2303986 RepID=UPI0013148906|nr:FAD-dependent oxidoreductase [Geodermatophilus sp. LHW52908]